MRILIAGSTGLVGTALVERLIFRGDTVVRLLRPGSVLSTSTGTESIPWEPERGKVSLAALEGFDAFINLAGSSIAIWPYNEENKRLIHNSRVASTSILAHGMTRLKKPPKIFISASAVGFYGSRGDEKLTEQEWPGRSFLSDVASAWEQSAKPARELGVRVVHPRLGIIFCQKGGVLQKMLTPFKLGLGAQLGDGKQYMSWVGLDDVIASLLFMLDHQELNGGVNVVAPNPVTNAEFTKILAKSVHRPVFMRAPAGILRGILGEMGQELFLTSIRGVPEKLQSAGFIFQDEHLSQFFSREFEKGK